MRGQTSCRLDQHQELSRSQQSARIAPCRLVQVEILLLANRPLFRHASSLTSCFIGQPLAYHATQDTLSAGVIIDTKALCDSCTGNQIQRDSGLNDDGRNVDRHPSYHA
jgi:hypothetical protein